MSKSIDEYRADGFTAEDYAEWQSWWRGKVVDEIGDVVLAWMEELVGEVVLTAVFKRQLDAGEYGPLHPDYRDRRTGLPYGWEPPTLTRLAKMVDQMDEVADKLHAEES